MARIGNNRVLEFLLLSFLLVNCASGKYVEKLMHALQDGDQFVTDISTWKIDAEEFICLVNGTVTIIEIEELCNGNITCTDGADESELICHALERCPEGKVKCPLESICLTTEQLCDGISDCTQDAWDERETAGCATSKDINSKQLSCADGMFFCQENVKCLRQEDLCNHKWDCSDGSDEDETQCPHGRRCPDDTFHCYKTRKDDKNFLHHCVTMMEVCNQIGDCPNWEDEREDMEPCTINDLFEAKRRHYKHHQKGKHNKNHTSTDAHEIMTNVMTTAEAKELPPSTIASPVSIKKPTKCTASRPFFLPHQMALTLCLAFVVTITIK